MLNNKIADKMTAKSPENNQEKTLEKKVDEPEKNVDEFFEVTNDENQETVAKPRNKKMKVFKT